MTNKLHDIPLPRESEPVSEAFRIGDPENTTEFAIGNRRFLEWIPNGHEDLAELAGWSDLGFSRHPSGLEFLEIPEGTRSASTVLSGMEAWEGEKIEVLGFIANYAVSTFLKTGEVDTGVTLNTVGVTKAEIRKIFATPPHQPEHDTRKIQNWVEHLLGDTRLVLDNDPFQEQIMAEFERSIGRLATKVE